MDEPLSSKAHKLDQPGLSHVLGDLGVSSAVTSSGRTVGRGAPGDDAATRTMPALSDRLRPGSGKKHIPWAPSLFCYLPDNAETHLL